MHSVLDWVGYWFFRTLAWIVQRLPIRLALGLGRLLGTLAYFFTKRRGVDYANLKKAFPESSPRKRKRWIKDLVAHLGMCGVEIMRFPILRKEDTDRLVTTGPDYGPYQQARQSGQGIILLTAHLGNWEFSQIVEGLRGRPLAVFTREQKYPRLNQLLNSFRQHYGSVSIGKRQGGIKDLIRTLRKGGCVGILGDQSGRDRGVWIRFFGRLTTSPAGPMALALKLGARVIPAFFVRKHGPYHHLSFDPSFELVRTGDPEKDIQINTQNYINLLEQYLTKYPQQWLWGHKRWKYTRTKRVTILSDGKLGHAKQSEVVVKELVEAGSSKNPPYEIEIEKIEVRFRSLLKRKIFSLVAFFFIPLAQGRLRWLRFFLEKECAEKLEKSYPDLIISAGASLVPLNLCMARENLAKSVVVMKPSFPYNLFQYDLAFIPAHDQGIMPRGHFRIQGALSGIDEQVLEKSKQIFMKSIRNPGKIRFSLFLGGETKNSKLSLSDIETLLTELDRVSKRGGGDYLITTSRRTPEGIERFVQSWLENHPRCQQCIIATRDQRSEVVPGMMALAEFLIVTEDSLSMISEALSSGKKVIVVKTMQNGLPEKHLRFQEILKKEWEVPVVEAKRLSEVLNNGGIPFPRKGFERERLRIREKLESLL